MDCAWMIRRDGAAIPVEIHIYGSFSNGGFGEDRYHDVKETIEAGEWLAGHAIHEEQALSDLTDLCQAWIRGLYPDRGLSEFRDLFITEINKKPRAMRIPEIITAVESKITMDMPKEKENSLNDKIVKEINQDFLRARIGAGISTGDVYNTDPASTECVFRISSVGVDWLPIIGHFVSKNKNRIGSVTVIRDFESTSHEGIFSYQGLKFAQMPTEEFLLKAKTPIFNSKKARNEQSEFLSFYSPFDFRRRDE